MFDPRDIEPKEGGGLQKPQRQQPGRGVLDGIRKDLQVGAAAAACTLEPSATPECRPGALRNAWDCRLFVHLLLCVSLSPLLLSSSHLSVGWHLLLSTEAAMPTFLAPYAGSQGGRRRV